MIPRFQPQLSLPELLKAPLEEGGSVEVLEESFKAYFGFSHAVWFPYARTAIWAYLENLNIAGKGVVHSPFNCVALAQAISAAKGRAVYVDTEAGGFNQDVPAFLAALRREQSAVGVAVALWGTDVDTTAIASAQKPILYDFALRGLVKDQLALKDDDAVVYSMGWGKPLSFFQGAMLCGSSASRALEWREWRERHLTPSRPLRTWMQAVGLFAASRRSLFATALKLESLGLGKNVLGKAPDAAVSPNCLHWAPRWTYALGVRRLQNWQALREERLHQVDFYREALSTISEVRLPSAGALSHFPIRVAQRDDLHQFLKHSGIFSSHRLFGELLSDLPPFQGVLWSDLVHAKALVATTLHLPLYAGLDQKTQSKVVDGVKVWLKQKKHQERVDVAQTLWGRV